MDERLSDRPRRDAVSRGRWRVGVAAVLVLALMDYTSGWPVELSVLVGLFGAAGMLLLAAVTWWAGR